MTKPLPSKDVKEDLAIILDSTTGKFLIELALSTIRDMRKALVTSTTLGEQDRAVYLGRVQGTHTFLTSLYEAAGRELPAPLESYFTGDT